ncbi:MAG: hypothetical protein D6812_16255, partial [Deltaproteobacteria bacterium]
MQGRDGQTAGNILTGIRIGRGGLSLLLLFSLSCLTATSPQRKPTPEEVMAKEREEARRQTQPKSREPQENTATFKRRERIYQEGPILQKPKAPQPEPVGNVKD